MRVVITGAGGQVGQEVAAAFGPTWDVVALKHGDLDVSDRDAVLQVVAATGPDVVVHTAAWTAVDACEEEPDRAYLVNALGTRHVAEAARRCGAHLCYLSTDYVFDGAATRPYTEWDDPRPLSVYGRSKLGGERSCPPEATIVRTSWVCGLHGANMARTVLRLARQPGPLRFVDDQHGSPTMAADLAQVVRRLAVERRPGLFHVTNQGRTTWYGFARAVLAAAGLGPERVEPIATALLEPPRQAPRPAFSVLDNAALRLSGLPLPPAWEDSLGNLVKELVAG
jgi:dTDP-4-dehydrorhamnose reductase